MALHAYQFIFRQVEACVTTWRKPWRRWTEKKCLRLHAGVLSVTQAPEGNELVSLAGHYHAGELTIRGHLGEQRMVHVACLHAQARVGGTDAKCGSRLRIQLC